MRPLNFPKYWLEPTSIQRILRGLPLIGVDRRAYRSICAQLLSRSPSVWCLWPEDLVITAKEIAGVVEEYFRWPNPYYIPDDPCEVLFWDPTMEMRFEEASLVLSDKFGFPEDRAEELREGTFGALIERVSVKDNRSHR